MAGPTLHLRGPCLLLRPLGALGLGDAVGSAPVEAAPSSVPWFLWVGGTLWSSRHAVWERPSAPTVLRWVSHPEAGRAQGTVSARPAVRPGPLRLSSRLVRRRVGARESHPAGGLAGALRLALAACPSRGRQGAPKPPWNRPPSGWKAPTSTGHSRPRRHGGPALDRQVHGARTGQRSQSAARADFNRPHLRAENRVLVEQSAGPYDSCLAPEPAGGARWPCPVARVPRAPASRQPPPPALLRPDVQLPGVLHTAPSPSPTRPPTPRPLLTGEGGRRHPPSPPAPGRHKPTRNGPSRARGPGSHRPHGQAFPGGTREKKEQPPGLVPEARLRPPPRAGWFPRGSWQARPEGRGPHWEKGAAPPRDTSTELRQLEPQVLAPAVTAQDGPRPHGSVSGFTARASFRRRARSRGPQPQRGRSCSAGAGRGRRGVRSRAHPEAKGSAAAQAQLPSEVAAGKGDGASPRDP
ncbi:basic proline-rich protein-like [Canis lupus familiaris]|uniref:basic proline-rich protein-like n=1 Tax=Canis lupus familiaris TaxID=9615 RepID=UPI0018F6A241|nr:basic proline-rich protein-like [Canis lupus familiaris]